jgi:hypothetical protein
MARTTLTAEALSAVTGLEPTVVNPDHVNGNDIANSPRGRVFLRVANGEAVEITAKANVIKTVAEDGEQLTITSPEIAIPAGETRIIGPWSNNFETTTAPAGRVNIDWTGITTDANVDIEALKIV